MSSGKLGSDRQVEIPEDIRTAIGASIGDIIEFIRRDDEVLLKVGKATGSGISVPPAPAYEERIRLLKELEGDAEDDSYNIPIEEIRALRPKVTSI